MGIVPEELERRLGRQQSVTLAKLRCSQEVSHSGDNRGEKNADRGFTLEEKLLQQIQGLAQITATNRVAQLPDDAGGSFSDQPTNKFQADFPAARRRGAVPTEEQVDFLNLVFDLPRVCPGQSAESL